MLGPITSLVTIATELTTNRANTHLNGAGDRAKGATLFVELSNCVSLLSIHGGKSFQPVIYGLWIIQPAIKNLAGCLFIPTVALVGGMCMLYLCAL